MSRHSLVINAKLAPSEVVPCPTCDKNSSAVTFVRPSKARKVWTWLIGKGWHPRSFVVMRPCDHTVSILDLKDENHVLACVQEVMSREKLS